MINSSLISGSTGASPYLLSSEDSTPVTLSQANTQTNAGGSAGNIDAVSKDFEAVFLTQMMGQMFSGDELTSFFGGGSTGEIYKGYLLNEYGKTMANAGGIGIASVVKQELLKLQEVQS